MRKQNPPISPPAGMMFEEREQAFRDAAPLIRDLDAAGLPAGRKSPGKPARTPPRARAIDKTDQGDQLVLPSAERRTLPGSVHSVEADGQLIIAGEGPVSDAERAQAAVDAPLRPRRRQKPPPRNGLFRI
jgi:hypothetical protein